MAVPFFIHSSIDELNSNLPPNRDHRATLRLGDGVPLVAQISLYRGGAQARRVLNRHFGGHVLLILKKSDPVLN